MGMFTRKAEREDASRLAEQWANVQWSLSTALSKRCRPFYRIVQSDLSMVCTATVWTTHKGPQFVLSSGCFPSFVVDLICKFNEIFLESLAKLLILKCRRMQRRFGKVRASDRATKVIGSDCH